MRRVRRNSCAEPPTPLRGLDYLLARDGRGRCAKTLHFSSFCECFPPWRGPSCTFLDAAADLGTEGHVNAAIYYLTSQQPDDLADLELSLAFLWDRYNRHHDYPVVILHDGLEAAARARLLRSPNRIWFTLMDDFVDIALPAPAPDGFHSLSRNPHHFSDGYKRMCEYRAGKAFLHPVFAGFDYLMHLDTDSFLIAEVEIDPFLQIEEFGYVYGSVATKDVPQSFQNHLWEVTQWYMQIQELDPTEFAWLQSLMSWHFGAHRRGLYDLPRGKVFMTDFEVMRLGPFRDPDGLYHDYFRFLQALDGFHLHGWGKHLMQTFAVAMFFETALVPVPYAHQMDCHCGLPGSSVCVFVPGEPSSAYLRNMGVPGMFECWPEDRVAVASCTHSEAPVKRFTCIET